MREGAGLSMRGASPAVTVVIPTRDRAELLGTALDAILAQTRTDLEVIVVDDGSTDATPAVIAAARSADPRVVGLRQEPAEGAAAARNLGAARARGRYLLFEDDDCRSDSRKVERLADALEGSPGAAYAYCWMRMRDADGDEDVYGGDGPWSISTSCALLRRERFREIGGFDARLPRLQDFDLFTRLLARHRAVEVPEVLFEMHRGAEGISASTERLLEASELLLRKYADGGIPDRHRASMHRRLGGKLLMAGYRRPGLAHFRASVAACRSCLRSWSGLAAALAGPTFYRWVAGTSYRIGRRRGSEPPRPAHARPHARKHF